MAMGERPALHVLPRQSDMVSLKQQRPERHGLRGAPVNVSATLRHRLTSLENFAHLAMQLESIGDFPRLPADQPKHIEVYASGSNATVLPRTLEPCPPGTQPIFHLWLVALACLVVRFVGLHREVTNFLRLLLRHRALLDQPLFVDIQRGRVPRDGLVQLRLSEHGLVHLIVPEATVANHVDYDVGAPLVPPLHGSLERA
mmetsp:Transcript_43146/g.91807  ORF Transcript_43146/g.91807 Transcript_43146/m.91807 type:complete len:200 (-) Transcript_43146:441-1040(-)